MCAQVLGIAPQGLTLDAAVRLFIGSRHRKGGRGGEVSKDTLAAYETRLGLFVRWADERGITEIRECRPDDMEEYILYLRERRRAIIGPLS